MHFLCLHGMGTNSQVFEMQTAAIRYALGDHHTYDFLEGSVPAPMAPGIENLASTGDEFFTYADETSGASCSNALDDLETYILETGPFDGIMAFSQGARVSSSLMVRKIQQDPTHQRLYPLFKCAVFFCGGVPEDPSTAITGLPRRNMRFEEDGEVVGVPTAHIWGKNDKLYPGCGAELSALCERDVRADFVHEGGHEVPGAKDPELVKRVVRIIKRTVERALERQ